MDLCRLGDWYEREWWSWTRCSWWSTMNYIWRYEMMVDNASCGGEFATNWNDQDDNDNIIYFTPSSRFLCLCCTPSVVIELSVGTWDYCLLSCIVVDFLLKNRKERGSVWLVEKISRGYKASVGEFFFKKNEMRLLAVSLDFKVCWILVRRQWSIVDVGSWFFELIMKVYQKIPRYRKFRLSLIEEMRNLYHGHWVLRIRYTCRILIASG